MIPRIGIVGAGQLGLMLCRAARELGLETVVATADRRAPALDTADAAIVGALDDPALAARFVGACDVVTFETESVPEALLAHLATAEARGEVVVRPGVEVMRTIRNKARQKAWMVEHRIPTLPFRALEENASDVYDALVALGMPVVQKTQVGGYDGQGVQVLRRDADLTRLWPVPSLLEPCLVDRTEIAVVLARGADGSIRSYAPVHMRFDDGRNILDSVQSPAPLDAQVLDAADRVARRVVAALDGIGVFSVEMFVTPHQRVFVNEISPRVHNAGHHTIEACPVSQFAQHLRAVAGLDLAPTDGERPAFMRNLLYDDALSPLLHSRPGCLQTSIPDTFVHWYGKRDARAFRKMGHVTVLQDDPQRAARCAEAALAELTAVSREAAA